MILFSESKDLHKYCIRKKCNKGVQYESKSMDCVVMGGTAVQIIGALLNFKQRIERYEL